MQSIDVEYLSNDKQVDSFYSDFWKKIFLHVFLGKLKMGYVAMESTWAIAISAE